MTKEHYLGQLFIKYYSSYHSDDKKIFDLVTELALNKYWLDAKEQLISKILLLFPNEEKEKITVNSTNEEILNFISKKINTSEKDIRYGE